MTLNRNSIGVPEVLESNWSARKVIQLLGLGRRQTNFERIGAVDTFEDFDSHFRQLVLKDLSVNEKNQFIQKFMKKVEVGIKTYKVHFIVDQEHYQRELDESLVSADVWLDLQWMTEASAIPR